MNSVPTVYLDSSALLLAVLDQPGGAAIADRLNRATRIHTSRLTRIECARALHRLRSSRERNEFAIARIERELGQVLDRAEERQISEEVCQMAEAVAPGSGLRSLDVIHLASWFLTLRIDPETELLTCDRRFAAAAGVEPL